MKKILLCLLIAIFFAMYTVTIAPCTTSKAETEMTEECKRLPIIMYHSVLKSACGAYCVHPAELQRDLKNFAKLGYRTVTISEVIAYAEGSGILPPKPILITFDDGHYNNLYYAYDILKANHCTAVLNVIGCFSEYSTTSGDRDHPEYSHLTWDEITKICSDGVFEIGNHSYAMHTYKPRYGITKRRDESVEEYTFRLVADTTKMQDVLLAKSGVTSLCYAYPFGAYSDVAQKIICNLGYKAIFTCREKINTLRKGNPDCLLALGRFNRDGRISSETFVAKCGLR